jgi:predicted Zn-dependent protease
LLASPDLDASGPPRVKLERALNELRESPSASTLAALRDLAGSSDEARFHYAEALFFAGMPDSALAEYKRVSERTDGAYTGAAFDRMFLIEDARPKTALPDIGRLMYLDWRGDPKPVLVAADSLYQTLPHGPLWSRVALLFSERLESTGQLQAALAPLLAVADDQPDDRLAPVARQRAGDLYVRLKQEPEAIAQYEACLTRYPKAWNSAEVRRRLETLRKGSC